MLVASPISRVELLNPDVELCLQPRHSQPKKQKSMKVSMVEWRRHQMQTGTPILSISAGRCCLMRGRKRTTSSLRGCSCSSTCYSLWALLAVPTRTSHLYYSALVPEESLEQLEDKGLLEQLRVSVRVFRSCYVSAERTFCPS